MESRELGRFATCAALCWFVTYCDVGAQDGRLVAEPVTHIAAKPTAFCSLTIKVILAKERISIHDDVKFVRRICNEGVTSIDVYAPQRNPPTEDGYIWSCELFRADDLSKRINEPRVLIMGPHEKRDLWVTLPPGGFCETRHNTSRHLPEVSSLTPGRYALRVTVHERFYRGSFKGLAGDELDQGVEEWLGYGKESRLASEYAFFEVVD